MTISGAARPSGLDAASWRRLYTSLKSASNDLCHSLAITAHHLCINFIDPSTIAPFLACHLIALNKNPDVHLIGIGDTARQIVTKGILTVTRLDIQETAGSLQLCMGQICGIEAAVHAVDSLFQQEETEAIPLVNAFNSLNHLSALYNIRRLCPSRPQSSSTHIGHQLNSLLMKTSTLVKAPLKGTPLLCLCMHLQQFPLLRSYIVISLMLVKYGTLMTILLLGKLLDYVSGGVNWLHKVPNMATLLM